MAPHQKHTKLARPFPGVFSRHEWAILGTDCAAIRALAEKIALELSPEIKTAYADADHPKAGAPPNVPLFDAQFTDKIAFRRFDERRDWASPQDFRTAFRHADLALVNGNHFTATRQLVGLDPKKFESLARKLDRLTAVDAFLQFPGNAPEPPDFLKTHWPNWAERPVLDASAPARVAAFLQQKMAPPPLLGLILAGGRSTRMGFDKSLLDWHGKPQREHLADLLGSLGILAHFSCRAEQAHEFAENQRLVPDTFLELGPMGAILSAFRERPDAAWLVLASDLPLLDSAALQFLMERRRTAATATAFRSPVSPEGFPEPLAAIWEPRAYGHLLGFLAQGVSCPRKALINSDAFLVDAPRGEVLTNANTPEERAAVLAMLKTP